MKKVFLKICKALGLFAIARLLTAHRPRILCYHGISLDDEWRFRPGLFMRAHVFRRRMTILRRSGFECVDLDEIARQYNVGRFKKDQVVVTVDDGWAGVRSGMFSVTQAHGFPATLYLSTYYVEDQRPVFNVALDYLFWKYGGLYQVLPSSCLYARAGDEKVTAERIKEIVSDLGTELESIVIRELCQYFGESYEEWLARGKLMFLSESDVKKLGQQGVNLELHTHRHRFAGIENGGAEREVNENLAAIHRICGGRPRHFCYPSGEYHHEQVRLLKDAGVSTATTTRNELVSLSDPLLELPRIMDSEHVSEVEFEAELSGFMSLLRQIRPSRSGAGRAPVPSVER